MTGAATGSSIEVEYFDGRSAAARRVRLLCESGRLRLLGDGLDRPLAPGELR